MRAQAGVTETGDHLFAEAVRRLLRGELGSAERRRVVRHLLAGCPECRALGRGYLELADHPLNPEAIFRGKPKRRGAR